MDEYKSKGIIKIENEYLAEHGADTETIERLIAAGEKVYIWSVQDLNAISELYWGSYAECLEEAGKLLAAGEGISGIAKIYLKEFLLNDYCSEFVPIEELISEE